MLIAKEEEKVFALKIYNSKKQGEKKFFFREFRENPVKIVLSFFS